MNERNRSDTATEPTSGQVVAAAAAAAAVVASAVVGIGRATSREPEPVVLHEPPPVTLGAVAEAVQERVRGIGQEAPEKARSAGRRLEREAKAAATRLQGAIEPESQRLAEGARRVSRRGGEKGLEVAVKVKQAKKQAQRVGDETASMAQAIAAQAAAAAVARAGRALGLGATIAGAARGRVPVVRHRRGSDVVPSVREIALQAASSALDLWQAARERAGDVAGVAESEIGRTGAKAAQAAQAGSEQIRAVSAAAAGRASQRVGEVGGKATEVRDRARGATARTAVATVDVGKDTAAALVWAAAAAGLVGYALLDPEQRQQVVRLTEGAAGQVRELVRDFQGYDDEF